jgi:uncharacterized protein (TIGR02246 family)
MTSPTICSSPDEVVERWRDGSLAADADALAALFEEDATFFASVSSINARGRAAIRASIARAQSQFETEAFEIPPDPITVSGDNAYAHRVYQMTLRNGDTAELLNTSAAVTEVFHRGADGGWRYAILHA